MATDMLKLLRDHSVTFYEHGEDPHAGEGWIQMDCPYCEDEQPHLGWCQDAQVFKCWHCGRHPITYTVCLLLRVPYKAAAAVIERYPLRRATDPATAIRNPIRPDHLRFPETTGPLNKRCAEYLRGRDFEPLALARMWELRSTSPVDRNDWADRVIIPFHDPFGLQVSYQGRTIQPDVSPPYRSCPPDLELVPHKTLLYGAHLASHLDTIIVVEGAVDVWRLGPGTVGTSGTGYTDEQVEAICQWGRRFIMYDADARDQAEALAERCSQHRGWTAVVTCPWGDPGSLPADIAAQVRHDLLGLKPMNYNRAIM